MTGICFTSLGQFKVVLFTWPIFNADQDGELLSKCGLHSIPVVMVVR